MNQTILAIGELLIDFVPHEQGVPLHEVTTFTRVAGGAPANVVTAVARLGGHGTMLSQVGNDAFGEHIVRTLSENGVDTQYISTTDRAHTGLAFVSLTADGDRQFSFYRDPAADLYLSEEQLSPAMFDDCAALHFCSVDLVPSPMRGAHRAAIDYARRAGAIISFDPNVRLPLWSSAADCQAAIREFLPLADLVKLSDDELEFVTGETDPQKAADALFAQSCKLLLLTRGGDGSEAYVPGAHASVPPVKVPQVVDTTGAGDSFIGSFLFQLAREGITPATLGTQDAATLTRWLTFSAQYASLTVQHQGAVMATMQEMQDRFGV